MKQVFDIIGQEVHEGDYVAISDPTFSTHGTKLTIYKVLSFKETPKQVIMQCWYPGFVGRANFRPLEWQEPKMIRLTNEQVNLLNKHMQG